MPHADGGVVWLSVRSAPLGGRHDRVRLRADHRGRGARRARPARIATIVDDSPDLVWMFDGRRADRVRQPVGLDRARAAPGRGDRPPVARDHASRRRADAARRARRRRPGRAAHAAARAAPARARRRRGAGSRARRRCASAAGSAIAVEITGRDVTRTRAAEDAGRRLSSQLEALVAGAPDGIVMVDEHEPDRGHQRAGVLAAGARAAPGRAGRPEHRRAGRRACARLLAEPDAAIARLQRDRRGAASRCASIFFECADGRRDRLRLRAAATAGRLWTVPRHHAVQAPGGGAARVPGHDEPRDQDAAVGDRGRGGAAARRRAAGSASASWPR